MVQSTGPNNLKVHFRTGSGKIGVETRATFNWKVGVDEHFKKKLEVYPRGWDSENQKQSCWIRIVYR